MIYVTACVTVFQSVDPFFFFTCLFLSVYASDVSPGRHDHGKTWHQVSAEQMLGELGLELEVHDARQADRVTPGIHPHFTDTSEFHLFEYCLNMLECGGMERP